MKEFHTLLKHGQSILFSPDSALSTLTGSDEYIYLLTQTVPFHKTENADLFPISDLAYIMNENNCPEIWTRDPRVLSQFIAIGKSLRLIPLEKKDNQILFYRYPGIKPVIHRERTHTDD